MTRVEKHQVPRRRVAEILRGKGLEVVMTAGAKAGYDFLVNGRVKVAIRASFSRMRAHWVTVRGKRYRYEYRSWHFNFHHHGRMGDRYADVFVCVGLESHRRQEEAVYVIPWEAVTGKTFSLLRSKAYEGNYAKYRDAWEVIEERATLAGGAGEVNPSVVKAALAAGVDRGRSAMMRSPRH